MYDGPVESAKYIWVNIWPMLDWTVGFCHRTAEIYLIDKLVGHAVDKQVRSVQNESLLWLARMIHMKIRTHCKA